MSDPSLTWKFKLPKLPFLLVLPPLLCFFYAIWEFSLNNRTIWHGIEPMGRIPYEKPSWTYIRPCSPLCIMAWINCNPPGWWSWMMRTSGITSFHNLSLLEIDWFNSKYCIDSIWHPADYIEYIQPILPTVGTAWQSLLITSIGFGPASTFKLVIQFITSLTSIRIPYQMAKALVLINMGNKVPCLGGSGMEFGGISCHFVWPGVPLKIHTRPKGLVWIFGARPIHSVLFFWCGSPHKIHTSP